MTVDILASLPIHRHRQAEPPPWPVEVPQQGAPVAHVVALPVVRPRTRGDCVNGPRPCPWIGCRHHLLLEAVDRRGRIHVCAGAGGPLRPLERWSEDELADVLSAMPATCSLDVAEGNPDGQTLAEVALLLGITRERIRQIEAVGLRKVRRAAAARRLLGDAPIPPRPPGALESGAPSQRKDPNHVRIHQVGSSADQRTGSGGANAAVRRRPHRDAQRPISNHVRPRGGEAEQLRGRGR